MIEHEAMLNRELSWLSFNERVLQEAADNSVPILERLKFLGIFSSNLDEFYRVRVANVQREVDFVTEEKVKLKKYGYDPSMLLDQMQQKILFQRKIFSKVYDEIKAELATHYIHIVNENEVTEEQQQTVKEYFRKNVLRKLVPLLVSNDVEEFPLLQDDLIYLAVKLSKTNGADIKYALIEIPSKVIDRFYVLPKTGKETYIMLLDDVIRVNLKDIFSVLDYDVYEGFVFKITRDAELDFDSDFSKSFLQRITKSLKERKVGRPVRLTYDENIPNDLLKIIRNGIRLKDDKFLVPGERYHNFKDFMGFPKVGRKTFLYPKFEPLKHYLAPRIRNMFKIMDKQDFLLHYPYHTFDYTIELLREAAIDPLVTEIKATVYRIAKASSFVNALINAHKNGKSVTVLVELQARFDERANINLANKLSEEGIRVIQGVEGLKVHSKLIYIERKRKKGIDRYGIIGTGNFHEGTAKLYSDTSLFTSNKRILKEVFQVFEFFETPYQVFQYKHLVVAPFYMREFFCGLIDNEIELAKKGRRAYIELKLNSLVDDGMIEKLYEAAKAGVKIKMIIRGICRLKAGVKGLSENIEVLSIVDKYLEHSRIIRFGNGGDELFYISSADWMGRNLNRRVEVAVPIMDENLKKELRDFMSIQWKDNSKSRIIDPEQKNNYKIKGVRKFRAQTSLEHYFAKKLEE
ncbi:MAG: polyphosphate kinase 1 [Bacteroidia bacterium]